jgi:hypothetical protein
MKEKPMTNTASFLKEITDNLSIISAKKTQHSPLRQVFTQDDLSSSPPQINSPPQKLEPSPKTGSTTSSGKSTMRSSDEKSTHESSDEDSIDSNEDLSLAEPTTTLMDASVFHTPRPTQDEITIHDTPFNNNSEEHTPDHQVDSTEDSFKTAKVMQTPHPNATSSLSSSGDQKSRSVRFASPGDPSNFTFDFTPQSVISPERPTTPHSSARNTPHNSPFKLFSQYDTFTKDKLGATVENLLPAPDAEDTEDLRMSRDRKRARREAIARDRVPRLPQNREIRHSRVASLTTQELVEDAEDFMRDLRSMPRPNPLDVEESAIADEEADIADEQVPDDVSSDFDEDTSARYVDYSQYSGSDAYDSIRQTPSPGKLNLFSSPGRAIELAQSPEYAKPAQTTSRVSSAESMQVITPDDVSHLLHSTVGSMTFDKQRKAWFKIRPSQMHKRKKSEDPKNEEVQSGEDEEEDIFKDIDDLVVDEAEEDEVQSNFSRPTSSRSGSSGAGKVSMIEEEEEDGSHDHQDLKVQEGGNGEEYHDNSLSYQYPPHPYVEGADSENETFNDREARKEAEKISQPNVEMSKPAVPIPPKSPLRKSVSVSPLPSLSSSPAKSRASIPPSPLRKSVKALLQDENIPPPQINVSPVRSPHRKTPSTEKRMRKSLPLPPLDTPEAIRIQDEMRLSSPKKMNSSPPKPHQPFSAISTPQPKAKHKQHEDSPFLEPRQSLRLSISPPPGDISFARTPRQDVSFSVTTRTLVKHLTDFEPFEPYWENLRFVDFNGKGATSLEGLKTFCPKLEAIDLRDCKVKYFTGLPSSMRVLKASGNRLDGLVSFAWGKNLQYLDLANNDIDSLAGILRDNHANLRPVEFSTST